MPRGYTEDTFVQCTTAEYLRERPGWKSAYAYNNEDLARFNPELSFGRDDLL